MEMVPTLSNSKSGQLIKCEIDEQGVVSFDLEQFQIPTVKNINPKERQANTRAIEKQRRDQLRDLFNHLKSLIPGLDPNTKTGRATILKETIDYIQDLQRKILEMNVDIDTVVIQNQQLQQENILLKSFDYDYALHGEVEMKEDEDGIKKEEDEETLDEEEIFVDI